MKKNAKRFISMLLAVSMVFGLLVMPAGATEIHDHEHTEEANTVAADKSFDFEVEGTLELVPLLTSGGEADKTDPAIIAVEKELQNMMVLNAEGEPVPLTEEQIGQVLYMFQQYLDQWEANANLLGVQVPFFLQYNDNTDGLGILGEMLAMDKRMSLDALRAGYITFEDITGMIMNFHYGDQLGLKYYGSTMASKRDEVMKLINNSGALTDAQKMLILNDWLAHNVTFDMPYIMNTDKEEGEKPMVAENPQQHEHYKDVYDVIYAVYEAQIKDTFEGNIRGGLEAEFKYQYYYKALKAVLTDMYTAGAVQNAAKNEQIIAAVKDAYWQNVYESAKAELMESEVYYNAYQTEFNNYLDDNCEHELSASKFAWTETKDAEGNGTGVWTATADVTCSICDRLYDDEPAVTENKKVEATCTEPEATVCVATITIGEFTATEVKVLSTVGEALGHSWDEGVVTKEPTETEKGEKTFTCSACGETKVEELDMIAHEHNYIGDVTTEPTCEEKGVKTFTCTCGDSYTEEIPATGHSDSAEDEDELCDDCGANLHEHTEEILPAVAATCGEDGLTEGKKCGTCGEILVAQEVVPATGEHADSDEDEDELCDVCGANMHEHTEEVLPAVAATCGKDGLTEGKKCGTCGEILVAQEVVPATGEHDTEETVTKEGNCGYAGEKVVSCKNCTYTETVVIPATGAHVDQFAKDGVCDICLLDMPVEGEHQGEEPVDATPEGQAIRDKAAGAADVAAKAAVETAANAEADSALDALTDEQIQAMAEDAVKNNPDAMAAIEAEVATMVQSELDAYDAAVKPDGKTVTGDPVAYVDSMELLQTQIPVTDAEGNPIIGEDGNPVMMTIAQQLHLGWDDFWADAQQNGIEVDPVNAPGYKMTVDQIVTQQMDTPQQDPMLQKYDQNGNPIEGEYMTPNEAIPVFAQQAAVGLTDGILNYWQGSHIGALGRGTAVCLGYTKAFTYLVQYMNPAIYGKSGANTDMSKSENWKVKEDLYYDAEGNLDINANYIVDDVRITFDADVTMYGETQENFNSDHFWNAVKVDGKWYYADPCYTDVYTEVMIRDRVETDGSMNHMYFIFSHTTAAKLYDGYFKEIKTLYEAVSTHTDYEDSWISRIKSNTYFDGGYAYYVYDSTDLITLMDDYNNNNNMEGDQDYESMTASELKLVRHKLTTTDSGDDGDDSYEMLIFFNYKENEDDEESVAMVYDPALKETVENELLTKLYAQHVADTKVYPSLAITTALYNGKLYFNLSNVVLSYEISSGKVEIVKEYNTVRGVRDDTNPFGGMAFTVTTGNSYDFEIENHPIAALTIKNDGKMYVSIATNFAFISGKDPHNSEDQSSFGYEFEESNFNPNYNSYGQSDENEDMYESYGYTKETNDNDEFMWSANFVETLTMSHLAGTSHKYAEVTVPAYCGRNAYTENRCTTCGASEPGTRVEVEGSALEAHHYVLFHETYYTKNDGGQWNKGDVYVCTICGFHICEPKEPVKHDQMSDEDYEKQMVNYEKEKAIYDEAVAIAGHTYVPTDAAWAADYSTVTFSALECSSICEERKPYLDCLLDDNTISLNIGKKVTADASIIGCVGTCPEGATLTYGASGELEVNSVIARYTVTTEVEAAPTDCDLTTGMCPICGSSTVYRIAGAGRSETAIEAADALKAKLGVEKFDTIIIASGEQFADALAGSYLAIKKDAPILLSCKYSVEMNEEYIKNNLADDGIIYILGGTAELAVPAEVEESLKLLGYRTKRLAGADRYETCLLILEEAGVTDEEILIATGWNFADSLSASATGLPIMMINAGKNGEKTELTDAQVKFLTAHASNKVSIIGGTVAIGEGMEATIDEIVTGELDRVYGDNRQATSIAVAKKYFEAPTTAFIAYAWNFPDGLCGGPLAYAYGAPLLLTSSGQEALAQEYVAEAKIAKGFILGGTAVVSDEIAKTIYAVTFEEAIPAL